MKTKILALLVLLTSLLVGCKEEKKVDDLEIVQPIVVDEGFKVTLDVIAKVDDDFALYYTEDGTVNFFDTKPVWQGFKGNESVQQVTFNLPEDVIPTQLRLDFGMKQDQPNIKVEKITLQYKSKKREIIGAEIFKFFRADENQCKIDVSTNEIIANVNEGKRLTPSLYPHQIELGQEIETLVKE